MEEQKDGENGTDMTRAERQKLKRTAAKEQRAEEKKAQGKKALFSKAGIFAIILGVAVVIAFLIYSNAASAGKIDAFSKCLAEKKIVIYGNDWCHFTQGQMHMFGAASKNLNYVVCDKNKELCDQKQITITPTWEINGKMVREVQSLEQLSALSGCKL